MYARKKIILKSEKLVFELYFHRTMNELRIKYQMYPKRRKIDAFEQKISIHHIPIHYSYQQNPVKKITIS